ncbi:RNA-binding protein 28-like [Salvia divinorum]|uniref:RNA-binding protein 28-like n=1 Tax=Salvia divinorum TaxID=28513 RepID=A0ABD1GJS6_SALDI
MGKNKSFKAGAENQQSPSTIFVSNLPFSLTNAQLEEAFSDVGPIRRCFMVMQKGSTEHRGFGYVQFAVVEDANRAIELKNGSTLGGRKIVAKQAAHHAPLEQRRAKENQGLLMLNRVAKTVICGNILNNDMAEEVHCVARRLGTVCSVTYPLPEGELQHHGLAQDGCKMNASSRYKRHVWARQLGGEGSKTQKWKLIVRNLPFKAKVAEIREMFATVGFVWDVVIPQNLETGSSKGFAFVKFTSKQDAEKAIQNLNGKKIGKRPIAVDWVI